MVDYAQRYCIVGAGTSGLAAAKNLKQMGIPCDVFEKLDDVGGNWYYGKPGSSVYKSTHLISSKPGTEYTDFPMPKEYPDYPSHWQAHEYIKNVSSDLRESEQVILYAHTSCRHTTYELALLSIIL